MNTVASPLERLDGPVLVRLLIAGIRHLFLRRDYINRINVFPVPDGDTGTNMAFTFKAVLDAVDVQAELPLAEVMDRVAEASLDGARGNSGAIMAQFMQGCREAARSRDDLGPAGLGEVCRRGAQQAWSAMSEPVPGTLPTVLEDFATALCAASDSGVTDLREQFKIARVQAQASLANTPRLLPALRQAGVVDAGAQGFVDLLEGMSAYIDRGVIDALDERTATLDAEVPEAGVNLGAAEVGAHRFCTECVIEGSGLDRARVMDRLSALEHSSLVVAGHAGRLRVHIHVNRPAEVFLACEAFGEIARQKADDMRRQHGLLNQPGRVAIVVDSGADFPAGEAERLGVHIVPVRVSLAGREYLDGVSLDAAAFYRLQEACGEAPQTSQPPPGDFRRVFEMLAGHGYQVLTVGLTSKLSGTTQAARAAAQRVEAEFGSPVRVFDTLNASCGQGLLAMVAAEAAAEGQGLARIERLLEELAPQVVTLAMPDELDSAIRGGRVPAWLGGLTRWLRVTPVLVARNGRMGLAGFSPGRGVSPAALARRLLKKMNGDRSYRVLVAHAAHPEAAREVRRLILNRHGLIHSCLVTDAGPALGVHLGKGGLIAACLPHSAGSP